MSPQRIQRQQVKGWRMPNAKHTGVRNPLGLHVDRLIAGGGDGTPDGAP